MRIELSQYEVSEIIANHFMNSPHFPNTDELRVRFVVEHNWPCADTLNCIVEEV